MSPSSSGSFEGNKEFDKQLDTVSHMYSTKEILGLLLERKYNHPVISGL